MKRNVVGLGVIGTVLTLLMLGSSVVYADVAPPNLPKGPKPPVIRPVPPKEPKKPATTGSGQTQPGQANPSGKGILAMAAMHYDAFAGIALILLMSGMIWHRYRNWETLPELQLAD